MIGMSLKICGLKTRLRGKNKNMTGFVDIINDFYKIIILIISGRFKKRTEK